MTETTQKTGFTLIREENDRRIKQIENFKNAPITRKAQTIGAVAVGTGAAVMGAMFAFQLITGAMALVVTGGVLAAGWYGLRYVKQADPLIQQKIRNHVAKAMFEEAANNAIHQLRNQVLENQQKLARARESRNKMGAMVTSLKDRAAKASESNKAKMLATADKIDEAYQSVVINVDKAQANFKEFELKVKDYEEMDRFNREAGAILDMIEHDGDAKLKEMLSLESFASIENEFNTAIISIEMSAKDAQLDNA